MNIFFKQMHQVYSCQSSKLSNQIEQGNMLSILNIKTLTRSDAAL